MSRALPYDPHYDQPLAPRPSRSGGSRRRRPRRTLTRLVAPSLLTLALVASPAALDPAQAERGAPAGGSASSGE